MSQHHGSWCLPGRQDFPPSRPPGQWPRRIGLLLVLLIGLLPLGCSKKIDEAEKIRNLVRSAAKAATERDIQAVLEWVAKDFRGQVGMGLDEGGGGTVARFIAENSIDTIDCGPALIGMHSPFEIASKADIYNTYRAYRSFFTEKDI